MQHCAAEAPFEWEAELLAAGPTSRDTFARCIREACDVHVEDGLDLELPASGLSETTPTPVGRSATVTLIGALGSTCLPLKVVVQLDEHVSEARPDYCFASVLEESVTSRVITCPATTAAALLLRTAVESDMAMTRPKVLWNLYRLISSGKVDSNLAPTVIAAVFAKSGTPLPKRPPTGLSEEFAAHESRRQMWEAYRGRARIPAPALEEVVSQVQRVVWPWLLQAEARRAA